MLRDRDAMRHPSDGGGRGWIEDAPGATGTVAVSSPGSWTIVYEAGPAGIEVGGSIRFIVSPFWGWSPPQTTRPDSFGYASAETNAEGVELELTVPSFLDIRIAGRGLREGERIRIVYGGGPAGALSDRYAEQGSRFWIGVDGDGDRVHALIDTSPGVDVEAGPPAQLQVVLPSTARPGDEVRLRVALTDRVGNVGVAFSGSVTLSSVPPWPGLPPEIEFEPEDRGMRYVDVENPGPGVVRVVAEAPDAGFEALSNPLMVDATSPRILWGDLHGHTALSDGTGTVEAYLRYARDVAGLDVASVTDHDHWGFEPLDEAPEIWEAIQDAVNGFDDPSRFVTLVGYEWTNWIYGHRHVLYFGEGGRLFSSLDPLHDTPAELWDALRGQDAMTFAHHSAGGPVPTDWSYAPDPELEPLTEIASVHGSSEAPDSPFPIYSPLPGNWVRNALDRGYRLGFVGSGDSHDGHPGLAHLGAGQGGVAAILSPDLTREGVAQALRSRRTYATNGPRIILQTALDGLPMGSEPTAPRHGEPSVLFVRVVACAPLERVDVIRSGRVITSIDVEDSLEFRGTVDLAALVAGEYVYVRAVQVDGGTAWGTPFFVN
jgi:hypothetical protein